MESEKRIVSAVLGRFGTVCCGPGGCELRGPTPGGPCLKAYSIADLCLGKHTSDDEMNRSLTKMKICFLGGRRIAHTHTRPYNISI